MKKFLRSLSKLDIILCCVALALACGALVLEFIKIPPTIHIIYLSIVAVYFLGCLVYYNIKSANICTAYELDICALENKIVLLQGKLEKMKKVKDKKTEPISNSNKKTTVKKKAVEEKVVTE